MSPYRHSGKLSSVEKTRGERAKTMNTLKILTKACAGLMVILLSACPAFAYKGENLAPHAKIGIARARAIALKAHPGAITDEELEREAGGTGLRYSFDIRRGGAVHEVGVDAETGRVLENAPEGKNPD
jgi:uncharacterized membrane protein YkoI